MPGTWYGLITLMLVAYAVLDGFDFGAGIVHLFVAKTEAERKTTFAAIGPVWDGNEVWLIAAGGVFIFAFPRAYAAAFSGLYLPLMMVLWLLVFRGIAVEFRSKVDHPLWRSGFDVTFAFSSTVMAIVLGVALGNLLRGVPLDATGYFHEDLFTTFHPKAEPLGAIDAYTALVGVLSVAMLGAHGATFMAYKTTGDLNRRAHLAAEKLLVLALVLAVFVGIVTALVQPAHFATFLGRPWLWPLPIASFGAGVSSFFANRRGREVRAFGLSCGFVGGMLVTSAATLYPILLRSTLDPAWSLDATTASSSPHTLTIGLFVWIPAMILAVGYFVYLYRSSRGKVTGDDAHE